MTGTKMAEQNQDDGNLTGGTRRPILVRSMFVRMVCSARARQAVLALFAAATLGACSSNGTEEEAYVEQPAEDLYNEALARLEQGDEQLAAQAFEEVERQHPYSQWATRGQLMAAYAFYEGDSYDEAVGAARRFIDLHPGHKDVAYAYYLIGVCYYEQISDVGRDQKTTQQALQSFDELIRRFPDSK